MTSRRIAMFANLLNQHRRLTDYGDDFFKDTRMSFGDHLEELRWRMWRAIKGLGLFLILGFMLDAIGDRAGLPWLGIGKPMIKVITDPVKEQVKQFYADRAEAAKQKLQEARERGDGNDKITRTVELRGSFRPDPSPDNPEPAETRGTYTLIATDIAIANVLGDQNSDLTSGLKGMGIMEAFMVYFKVSLLCGVILACPWIFYQMWAFIGAGLYPHEKKLVNVYLPYSVGLFIGGCLLCQFLVMPRAVEAMLAFYKWLDIEPDMRLNEWLSFALLMPLVFGISFQTPLVMMFLNKVGIVTYETHKRTWRYAMFGLAVGTALLCPSTDVVSWLSLFIPTFGLYLVGVLICYLRPPGGLAAPNDEAEVGV
jgi:sec-independent protein translocase protein TatC